MRWSLRSTVIALSALICCTTALAAAPKPGAVFKGHEPHCTAQAGLTCEFVFKVSASGTTMRFVGPRNVVGVWACHGGGGEAVLGPYKKPLQGQPVPLITIGASGALHGSQTFGPASSRGTIVVSGRFSSSGKTGTITFTMNPGPKSCTNGPVSLSAAP